MICDNKPRAIDDKATPVPYFAFDGDNAIARFLEENRFFRDSTFAVPVCDGAYIAYSRFGPEGYGQDVNEELSSTLLHGGSKPEHHESARRQSVLTGYGDLRRLTPMECERLQGFPSGWTAIKGSRKQRVKDTDDLIYLAEQHALHMRASLLTYHWLLV